MTYAEKKKMPPIFTLSVCQNQMEEMRDELKIPVGEYRTEITDRHRHLYLCELALESVISSMQTLGGILENVPDGD